MLSKQLVRVCTFDRLVPYEQALQLQLALRDARVKVCRPCCAPFLDAGHVHALRSLTSARRVVQVHGTPSLHAVRSCALRHIWRASGVHACGAWPEWHLDCNLSGPAHRNTCSCHTHMTFAATCTQGQRFAGRGTRHFAVPAARTGLHCGQARPSQRLSCTRAAGAPT